MPDGPVEAALDELYAADPGAFVATRKRLSAALRGEGDKVGAKLVQGARRPSTSAWALNQLARREPALVEKLLDTSDALYAAQTRGSNGPDVLRDAIRAHREAVEAATDAATAILGERSNDGFRSEIVSTLRAVGTDDEISAQLRTGRVLREASLSGFPDAVGLTLVPDLPAPKPKSKPKPEPKTKPRAATPATDLVAKEAARKEAAAAVADADRAHARVEELEAQLTDARRELTTALARSRKAKSTLRDLR
jgi:hypothetical protein